MRITLVAITVALLALAVLLAVTWLPRWWAQRVGDVVDGRISTGVFAGLVCGVLFTALPLLLLRRVFAWHAGSLTSRVVWLLLAAVLAAPNLTTLGIVLGNGNAAHAGERIFDVDAPAFRTASLVGAVVGALVAVLWWVLMATRRRNKRRIAELEARVREQSGRARDVEPDIHADDDADPSEASQRPGQTDDAPHRVVEPPA